MVHHGGLILAGAARILGSAALPIAGVSPWIGAGLVASVLLAALVVRALAGDRELRAELGRWLAIAAAGMIAALAAWAVYVPASDHYVPTAAGTVNRMNAAAAIGIAVLVYASAVLAVRVLGRLARAPSRAHGAVVAAAALALTCAYVARSLADARPWDAAAADQRELLADMHAALPRLGPAATVYVVGAPASVGPGIPVLGTTLDLTSAIRLSYSQPRLTGVPMGSGATIACGQRGPLAGGVASGYGEAYVLDTATRRAVRLLDPRACAAVARSGGGP
jgi:hypothetical protein